MTKSVAILLVAATAVACTQTFQQRVAAANAAIATPSGKIYDSSLAPSIKTAMLACVRIGKGPSADLGKFTFVSWVSKSGLQVDPQVQPNTRVSSCFSSHFHSLTLPPPPVSRRKLYPIIVEMTVR